MNSTRSGIERNRRRPNICTPGAWACAAALALGALAAPVPAKTVSSIEVRGNRVREGMIRERLAFREGGRLDDAGIELSRKNLYRLSLFRTLDITEQEDGAPDRVKVVVDAKDGWFVMPWALAGSRAGQQYAGGLLVERNLFRNAETLMAFGMFEAKQAVGSLMCMTEDYTVAAGARRASYDEYRYSDGSFNAAVLAGEKESTVARYGSIAGRYAPASDGVRLEVSRRLNDGLRAGFEIGAGEQRSRAVQEALPVDEGDIRSLRLFISAGESIDFRRDIGRSFGRIFGLGMADMAENFKELKRDTAGWGVDVSFEVAHRALGSDLEFQKGYIGVRRVARYRDRSGLTFSMGAAHGSGLPYGEKLATSREWGMNGVYAREFRGDTLALAGARYSHPLSNNRLCRVNGDFFLEYGTCFTGPGRDKRGAGAVLVTQFWRFPMPLGLGYTFSVDDNDGQASFSLGGAF